TFCASTIPPNPRLQAHLRPTCPPWRPAARLRVTAAPALRRLQPADTRRLDGEIEARPMGPQTEETRVCRQGPPKTKPGVIDTRPVCRATVKSEGWTAMAKRRVHRPAS